MINISVTPVRSREKENKAKRKPIDWLVVSNLDNPKREDYLT